MTDSKKLWTDVDQYFSELFIGAHAVLGNALAASARAGLPDIAVSPNQGKLLHLLVHMTRAQRVLEIGTLGGYSTIWMARALPADGRVVTLELDAKHAAVARDNFKSAGVATKVELFEGAAINSLQLLVDAEATPFDLVFIDADKASIPQYFAYALKLTQTGSVIVVDNVVRDGAIIDKDSTDASVRGVRQFTELAAAEPRVTATALQTVGVKGYDGFAIMLVVEPPSGT